MTHPKLPEETAFSPQGVASGWDSTPADELAAIADELTYQLDEPWPGSDSARLHYWRDKAIKAGNAIRALAQDNHIKGQDNAE